MKTAVFKGVEENVATAVAGVFATGVEVSVGNAVEGVVAEGAELLVGIAVPPVIKGTLGVDALLCTGN